MQFNLEIKGYGFLSFCKNIAKNIGKNISKTLSGKYGQNLPDHAKQSATDSIKNVSKREIQETAEATDDLIESKITRVSKNSPKNNSERK